MNNTGMGIYMIFSNTWLMEISVEMHNLVRALEAEDIVEHVGVIQYWEDDGTSNCSLHITFNVPEDVEEWNLKDMLREMRGTVHDTYLRVAGCDNGRMITNQRLGFTPLEATHETCT